jgi:nucleotide-binding universal stress UspA family protein
MARKSGAAIELLTLTTAYPPNPPLVGFRMDPLTMTPEEVLDQGRKAAGDEVVLRARELYEGSVAAGLAEGSDTADLIVIGSRSYGFLARVMVGSVSTELIHSASCPVLVAPRAGSEANNRADEAPAQLERRRWTPSGAV